MIVYFSSHVKRFMTFAVLHKTVNLCPLNFMTDKGIVGYSQIIKISFHNRKSLSLSKSKALNFVSWLIETIFLIKPLFFLNIINSYQITFFADEEDLSIWQHSHMTYFDIECFHLDISLSVEMDNILNIFLRSKFPN